MVARTNKGDKCKGRIVARAEENGAAPAPSKKRGPLHEVFSSKPPSARSAPGNWPRPSRYGQVLAGAPEHGMPGGHCSAIPVAGFKEAWQNSIFTGPIQRFEFLSQANPGPQEFAPGQHTPPTGAQLNLLGQRKKPGCIGHGGPVTAVNCVPGGMTIMVPGRIVIITTGLAPSARGWRRRRGATRVPHCGKRTRRTPQMPAHRSHSR